MPYLMGGYPDLETSRRIGLAYAEAGADLIELGVPFSDPLADGPVIHAAGTAALRPGADARRRARRGRATSPRSVPVVLMCYANLILARGLERFADALVAGRGQRPDRPRPAARGGRRRSGGVRRSAAWRWCRWSRRPRPTSGWRRSVPRARGFVYAVSRDRDDRRARRRSTAGSPAWWRARAAHTEVPVAVGFGIGTPEQAGRRGRGRRRRGDHRQPPGPRRRRGRAILPPPSPSWCAGSGRAERRGVLAAAAPALGW